MLLVCKARRVLPVLPVLPVWRVLRASRATLVRLVPRGRKVLKATPVCRGPKVRPVLLG
ncbi:hypothetical protein GCM10009839_41220 [Catenulispora yoronensis]|uniref:Uncharacterized protein n=1 Tax=Catenulispora yoronensis TaxID=450799 RepID=A0ABN2UFH5_9ACTN